MCTDANTRWLFLFPESETIYVANDSYMLGSPAEVAIKIFDKIAISYIANPIPSHPIPSNPCLPVVYFIFRNVVILISVVQLFRLLIMIIFILIRVRESV